MRMRFEEDESSTRWSRFSRGIWKWGALQVAVITEQARNDDVRIERQLGPAKEWGLGDSTPGCTTWVCLMFSETPWASPPMCACLLFGLN